MFYNQLECYKKAFKRKYPGKNPNRPVDVTFKEGYVYDSIWAIALALNRTMEQGVTLENFTYDNANMSDIMQAELRNSSFQGISVCACGIPCTVVCVRVCQLCTYILGVRLVFTSVGRSEV